jgi:PEGA domain
MLQNKAYRALSAFLTVFLLTLTALAKDPPAQVIVWPESGSPVLRFTFAKFKEVGGIGQQRTFMTETTAQNLWSKPISNANFTLYLFDKNKTRIGETTIAITNIGPGEAVKLQTAIGASGPPASLSLVAKYLPAELGPAAPPHTVSITVNSVPQGALFKLDGNQVGTTPKIAKVAVGSYTLEFTKEGFAPGIFPLEIGPDDASGGSVSFELGGSVHDTIEMQDGTVLSGDLVSVSGMEIVVRLGGKDQTYDRNQVKRIILVHREQPTSTLPPPRP